MADIALRNPQFKYILAGVTAKSVVCRLTIDGVLRYTLVKNLPTFFVPVNQTINFDIAELARDYLEIAYDNTYAPQSVAIETNLKSYDALNGTGNEVDTPATIVDKGFEAYGDFLDGSNPVIPFNRTAPTFLMANDKPPNNTNTFTILVPTGQAGKVPLVTSLGGIVALNFGPIDTTVPNIDNILCNIKRIDCTKYGEGHRIIFINKYGVQQDLWFFLKKTRGLARTNESYKANTITYPSDSPATYSKENAANKVFNTQGKQTYTLSSGFYPEFANQFFEELLLSEYIWLSEITNVAAKSFIRVPVKVKTSSIKYKTSVNDRLVEYTMEFEDAFDYINNIR